MALRSEGRILPVEIEWISGGVGVLVRATGRLTADDLTTATRRVFAGTHNLDLIEYAVVDGSRVESVAISVREIRSLAESDARISKVLRPGLRVALVFPRDEAFALARMWEVWAERTGWDTQVFRSLTDAAGWLGRQPDTPASH